MPGRLRRLLLMRLPTLNGDAWRARGLAGGKALTWTLFTLIAGLVPVWLTLGFSKFLCIPFSVTDLARRSEILILAMAVVSANTIDYFHSRGPELPRAVVGVVFALVPAVTGLFLAISFSASELDKENRFDVAFALAAQYYAFALTVLHSMVARYLLFLGDKKC